MRRGNTPATTTPATTTGSGGAAVTPQPLVPSEAVASSTVARNNTTVATDGTPLILVADAWNIAQPYRWDGRIIIPASTRLVVRTTAPVRRPGDRVKVVRGRIEQVS